MQLKKYIVLFILSIIVLLFYLQNRYAIPNIDDWAYSLLVDNNTSNYLSAIPTRQPIQSFKDAIISQSNEYFHTNGRFIIHVLVQYFCATYTIKQFALINSAVFLLFFVFLNKHIINRNDPWIFILTACALFIFMPYQAFVFYGPVSLCINYLWTCTATLLFLLLFNKLLEKQVKTLKLVIVIIFSIITGSLQESFSIALSATLIFYFIVKYKNINPQILLIGIAYLIGSAICILSPGNFQRAESTEGIGFHLNGLFGLLSSVLFIMFIIYSVIQLVKGKLCAFIDRYFIFISLIIINSFFIIFIAYTGRHQLMVINVFSFIIIIKEFVCYIEHSRLKPRISLLFILVFMVIYISVLNIRKEYSDAYNTFINRTAYSSDGTVDCSEFEGLNNKYLYNRFYNNYVTFFTFVGSDYIKQILSMSLTKGKSNLLIKNVLPRTKESIVNECNKSTPVKPSLYCINDGYMIYISNDFLLKDNIRLIGKTKSEFVYNSTINGVINPSEMFRYSDKYYYLFTNFPTIVHVDSLIVIK